MDNFYFKIVKQIGVIHVGPGGWQKELNLVSWKGALPKYDLREWSPNHDKVGKGITLTKEEAEELKDLLEQEL